jgi:hypothetical protein
LLAGLSGGIGTGLPSCWLALTNTPVPPETTAPLTPATKALLWDVATPGAQIKSGLETDADVVIACRIITPTAALLLPLFRTNAFGPKAALKYPVSFFQSARQPLSGVIVARGVIIHGRLASGIVKVAADVVQEGTSTDSSIADAGRI